MEEVENKKPFFIILAISIIVVISIFIFEKGSIVLNKSKYTNLDKIIIDAEYSDVEVKYLESKEVNVVVYGKKDDEISVKEINKTLTIKKSSTKGICIFNCDDKIILYLPKEFERLDVSLKMGNVNVEESIINDIYVKDDIGNVALGTVKSANIEVDVGNVEIKKIDAEFDSYIKVNSGNITVNHTNNLNVKANSNTGKVNVKNDNDKNEYVLTIETNVGNIKVK